MTAEPLPSEHDQNFYLRDGSGAEYVLKIANREEALEVLHLENLVLCELSAGGTGLNWPRVIPTLGGNTIVPACADDKTAYFVRLLEWMPGEVYAKSPHTPALRASLGHSLARIDRALADFDHPAAHRSLQWDVKNAGMARPHLRLLSDRQRQLIEPHFDAWEKIDWAALPASVIHGDANDYNVLVDAAGSRVVSILDLGDMVYTATVCDLAIALAYGMLDEPEPIAAAAQVVAAYHQVRPLVDAEIAALYPLAAARLAMSVCYCAWQSRDAPSNEYLSISNRPAWALLQKFSTLPPGWPEDVFRGACGATASKAAGLLAVRQRHLGPSVSVSYREPLHIVRGWREYLYDADGRAYLDCVNNVSHVGHCHPRVVQAAAAQMALLNTNTRYLHEVLAEYIARLTATLPPSLSVVYLVCSGSEANELALRLARAHTGRNGIAVMDTAYHGNTSALIDISPYKFNGPGGRGKPDHVEIVPLPDVYRGAGCDPKFAAGTIARLRDPAAFISESALSCGGQMILPAGYLQGAFSAIRSVGGVAIADEVQTGFGRAGSHFWMFETQGVTPDIVTLGKPIGNGHPIGAVITTPEIARSFDTGMEYFNTFGGNPVSCAVGLAVLDVIRDEGQQANALSTGDYCLERLRDLATRHPTIGDVRGKGLFLGVELVRDPGTRDPDGDLASGVVNRMKELGILLSTDGPHYNVLKIKPPMIFSRADVDLMVDRLNSVLP